MKYIANVDMWLSHECRLVKAGDEFETTFPNGATGKPMVLGDNLTEVKAKEKKPKADDLV